MQLRDVVDTGTNYIYQWPCGNEEPYPHWVDYRAIGVDGEHTVRIGFRARHTYGRDRKRVVVWIDGHPHAEFFGADDFDSSGDILAEIKVLGNTGVGICRYTRGSDT